MKPYYQDPHVTLWHGDALDVLRTLPDGSVDCCVTSPPYFGLRDYGTPGQYGLEASPAEYVERMRAVFAEVRRALADDGTLWLNIGDSYSGSWGAQGKSDSNAGMHRAGGYKLEASGTGSIRPGMPPAKNLLGIPWRLAFSLQEDGWILRNAIAWHKPNAMPSSVVDRLSNRYETFFLLVKNPRYWFDLDPIREPDAANGTRVFGGANKSSGLTVGSSKRTTGRTWGERKAAGAPGRRGIDPAGSVGDSDFATSPGGRNPGDVWTIPTQPFAAAHFAAMAPELARRAVLAGCKPGGVVLDPFSGSGTTGMVAIEALRRYVGIDLSSEYLDLSLRTRLRQGSLDLSDAANVRDLPDRIEVAQSLGLLPYVAHARRADRTSGPRVERRPS